MNLRQPQNVYYRPIASMLEEIPLVRNLFLHHLMNDGAYKDQRPRQIPYDRRRDISSPGFVNGGIERLDLLVIFPDDGLTPDAVLGCESERFGSGRYDYHLE